MRIFLNAKHVPHLVPDVALLLLASLISAWSAATPTAQGRPTQQQIPTFRVDPAWPKPLPNHWIIDAIASIAVDAQNHIWITHQPSTLQPNETRTIWKAAPPMLEFDTDGTLLSSWNGPGTGYEWPQLEHRIYIDARSDV